MSEREVTNVDVLVVGAGISGIGTAWHLQTYCPDRSFAILEGRPAIGGTWDLFRYPGIRSDSDMYTLGYSFEPWTECKAIADGPSILKYVNMVADKYDIRRHIRFNHHVVSADFDSETARWTVEARLGDGATATFRCQWLHMCSGYYDYNEAYLPEFEGAKSFPGPYFHAQFWPEDLDLHGKRVVVIGSGATAVTIVPEMAKAGAGHVTMLQRSPTYMASRPSVDKAANRLRCLLGPKASYGVIRWRNVLMQQAFFQLSRRRPEFMKKLMKKGVQRELPPDYEIETHFNPAYNPWDQRVCLVPDADLFAEIRKGRVEVVTDHIDRFTAKGIRLKSGRELEADIIVAATGLKLQLLSDVAFSIDGVRQRLNEHMTYKGMMFSNVPNLSYSFGYTNASWTLKADLTSVYVTRLLNHLARTGRQIATPRQEPDVHEVPFLDFSSGYVQRALAILPKQGDRAPWKLYQNYILDRRALRRGKLEDGVMQFSQARGVAVPPRTLTKEAA
ncbi:NAD(P)/FAD-dependent oxidoreductase [Sphingomonas sp. KRR8]|uniref:flavin-containing monooxygenase n=1 Tax=Sphingomonas sp. KRR8 TaxID=2942996 RepID=UPI00201FD0D3|nr:NAD(P)/FAD-dependent oxidoreductase [Sphingomonas sp. KRR8]URD60860.1 NAD(P)/FAD-dependent oxidoreductase [Sphingomonas sp. KRR8]